ncbi:MAG: hypothetical protein E6Y28_07265 [Staphylococcus epidermidis]|nr:hypothetical protein [Staphylococcus epidermidis]
MSFYKFIYWLLYLQQYFVLLARFLRGQLQPVVFSLSCSLKSLAKILCFPQESRQNTLFLYVILH